MYFGLTVLLTSETSVECCVLSVVCSLNLGTGRLRPSESKVAERNHESKVAERNLCCLYFLCIHSGHTIHVIRSHDLKDHKELG